MAATVSRIEDGLTHSAHPPRFQLSETPKFVPAVHLAIHPPTKVKTLDFNLVPFPYTGPTVDHFPGLAYTEPFRLLSDSGVCALRQVIDQNAGTAKQNERNHCIRGLGYRSQFVRDLSFCPEVLGLLSALAREELWPHDILMHMGHTNFGHPGTGKAVDEWHTDSTDYVFVLILSDTTDMEGGDLKVLQLADSSGIFFDQLQVKGIPADKIETVKYPGAGYCIFMQGTKILHSVTPVLSASQPRISFVNSYGSRNVFAPDRTRFSAMAQGGDPPEVSALEFARHKAWRVSGQLQHLLEEVKFGTPTKQITQLIEEACRELQQAKRLLSGEEDDNVGFLVQRGGDSDQKGKAEVGRQRGAAVKSKL